jgi:hypothetical protein
MEGLVLQVYKVVVGAAGSLMSAGFMPLAFENESEAFAYMDGYIASVFRFGKSGYNEVEEFWWGCEAGPELQIHRYRLEMRCTAADLSGIPPTHATLTLLAMVPGGSLQSTDTPQAGLTLSIGLQMALRRAGTH